METDGNVSCECFVFFANAAMNGVSPSQNGYLDYRVEPLPRVAYWFVWML